MKWDYIHIDNRDDMIMSGWKLYIYGYTIDCVHLLSHLLYEVVSYHNLTTKIANNGIINRNRDKCIPWSCMVIYLTDVIFVNNRLCDVIGDINGKLKGKYDEKGYIPGARSINDVIHYRYDVITPINPIKGLLYDDYLKLYRGEYGSYNIKDNKDIIN